MRASRWKIVASALVVVVVIGVAAVLLSGGSDDSPDASHTSADYQNYHQIQFAAAITNSWPQDRHDRRVGNYLESTWRYPLNAAATFTVDSSETSETGSPEAAATLARIQVSELPSYHQRSLKRVKVRNNPAIRWNFDLAGATHVEYFFEECGISLIARASAPPRVWRELASSFDEMAKSITANCDQ